MNSFCENCGATYKQISHAELKDGGGWTYVCSGCGKILIYVEYSETGFDEVGRSRSAEVIK